MINFNLMFMTVLYNFPNMMETHNPFSILPWHEDFGGPWPAALFLPRADLPWLHAGVGAAVG